VTRQPQRDTRNVDAIWPRDLPASEKLLLLAIATLQDRREAGERADWPAELVWMTGLTSEEVWTLGRRLIATGELLVRHRHRRRHLRLVRPQPDLPDLDEPPVPIDPHGHPGSPS
jgi:hypothetical protein